MQLGLYLQLNFNQVSYVLVLQFNAEKKVALRLVSEDPTNVSNDKSLPMKWFPADCLHRTDFHCE